MINANLLQLVVEASNDGIVVAEQEGEDHILIYANPAFEALTGYSSEEILYQDCRFLQGEERQQPVVALLRKAIHSRQACREVIRNYRKDGTTFWNELSITPVFNEADQLTYFIGIQKNVSEHVASQERVKALESEVQALHAELAELKKRL
ncbi:MULTISPECIES: PAS domain-containing protein [unclassified Pseudomonas]|uniref:PAS domain-containing protein n=1 Tax=unclassified Pseudomonas TaxID=196821 RepID=UPI000DAD3A41|nr:MULTISPECIES: PAS domain-containing protein [unclassified Pseudomonas]MBD9655412.1 PAS domain-containing protein [Pseudomonas sp. PDM12]PZW47708.1 PAS domain S-box-containing protein [Pseudomonas sp. URMO17WK12:I2]CAH0149564.1 Blue-light photoreceptor [Pseudomonas sp. Bi70]